MTEGPASPGRPFRPLHLPDSPTDQRSEKESPPADLLIVPTRYVPRRQADPKKGEKGEKGNNTFRRQSLFVV